MLECTARSSRKRRIAIGVVCLIVIALVMGWFVGRYIPGQPHEPEPQPQDGLTTGSGLVASEAVDSSAGSTLKLRGITQGIAYKPEADSMSNDLVNTLKADGSWEYDCPDVDVAVSEARVIAAASFAEVHPEYRSYGERALNDSALVVITLSITNASDNRIGHWYRLPSFTLYSDNLAYIEDVMGAGAGLDDSFWLLNSPIREFDETSPDPDEGRYVDLEPGESQTIVLPFKVNRTTSSIKAPSTPSTRPISACRPPTTTRPPPTACGCSKRGRGLPLAERAYRSASFTQSEKSEKLTVATSRRRAEW